MAWFCNLISSWPKSFYITSSYILNPVLKNKTILSQVLQHHLILCLVLRPNIILNLHFIRYLLHHPIPSPLTKAHPVPKPSTSFHPAPCPTTSSGADPEFEVKGAPVLGKGSGQPRGRFFNFWTFVNKRPEKSQQNTPPCKNI